MTKNHDKIVNHDIKKKNCDIIFVPYRPPLAAGYSQVQEIVLRKMHCTHSNIWVELFWNSVVNTNYYLLLLINKIILLLIIQINH